MLDVTKIQELIKGRPGKSENLPKHVIISIPKQKEEENEEKKKEINSKRLQILKDIVNMQIEYNIPIMTIDLGKEAELLSDWDLMEFFETDLKKVSDEKKIRVLVIGKWTKLTGYIVDYMKKLILETKDYNDFFLNFCIGYDGQTEILDACKLVLKKAEIGQENKDELDAEKLKENIYSSYFLPADLIIELGNKFTGTFLWDTKGSKIIFLNKPFQDFNKSDFDKSLDYYKKD